MDTILARDTSVKRDTTLGVRVPVPARADSLLHRDEILARDSARAAAQPRDTIKHPLAFAEAPTFADPGGSLIWDRKDVFATGALTVQDLLDRIPGVTGLRSGWIAQPMVSSFLGDPGRVRVFLDGLELTDLDPRMRGIWDLTQVPLWALDDIRVERGAAEIRIYMRSWRVDRTTPVSRTDIYTGDQSTNLYRGLFGRRYQHGGALQFAGQHFGTSPGRAAESSDQLGVIGRVGWAAHGWSTDAFILRQDRNRGRALSDASPDTVPRTESTRSDAYVRVGWGSPDAGAWVQGLAHASKHTFGGESRLTSGPGAGTTAEDTTRFRSQYLLTGGYGLGPVRASLTQRLIVGSNRSVATPAARASLDTRWLTVSAFAEGRSLDSTRRLDVSAVTRPVSFLFLAAAAGTERHMLRDSVPAPMFTRGEAGLRLRDLWLSGGVLRRDLVELHAPVIFRRGTATVMDSAAQGVFASIRGRIWKAVYADIHGIQWDDTAAFYRPRHQARSELYISTSLLDRFPTGNFHLLASVVHEYRSAMWWPDTSGAIRQTGYRTLSTLLQVRIINAEVFWNFRNTLGERYAQIPGYQLPRLINVYGVRWEFWN
ncbi:MAG: TonB-dependent receptor [Gemmatimonadaceae bacterium]